VRGIKSSQISLDGGRSRGSRHQNMASGSFWSRPDVAGHRIGIVMNPGRQARCEICIGIKISLKLNEHQIGIVEHTAKTGEHFITGLAEYLLADAQRPSTFDLVGATLDLRALTQGFPEPGGIFGHQISGGGCRPQSLRCDR
jgi:hypothetical protein